MAPIEPAGVCPQKPLHAGDQVGVGRLDHQVKMIGHQTIGMHLPGGLTTGFGQGLEEALSIFVVAEDGIAAVAAVHDVVHPVRQCGAWTFDVEKPDRANGVRRESSVISRGKSRRDIGL